MREFGIREEARRKHYGTHALKAFEKDCYKEFQDSVVAFLME